VPGRRTLRHVLRQPGRAPGDYPPGPVSRFWIWMQVLIVVFVVAAGIIAVVKLN
jgi:hypothetical protein